MHRLECQRYDLSGQPETEGVVENTGTVAVKVIHKTTVQILRVDGRFQVNMCYQLLSTLQMTAHKTACTEGERSSNAIGGKGQLAESVVEFLPFERGDPKTYVLQGERFQLFW